ncbi:hypothetical protein [Salinibacterium xinjiangense]|uniref:hypothetical protein n=1 Tax=Salinibacterium xinjiangense TaxID=386302 RepID=UPI0015CA6665|nr:hypothetical protein [Salinibacterium xinjiangense]
MPSQGHSVAKGARFLSVVAAVAAMVAFFALWAVIRGLINFRGEWGKALRVE